jgi:uncharacterized phage protein gp47/JayE
MSEAPKFRHRAGGGLSRNISFVTTIKDQVLEGELDQFVVDIQVNINGQGFKSDPSLVKFDQSSFVIPNPQVYPEGFSFDWGTNTVEVRSVDVTGALSPVSKASIEVLRPNALVVASEVPTGLRVRRRKDAIELVWAKNASPNTKGYNVYASTEEGGGMQGYVKINSSLISTPSFSEDIVEEVGEDTVFFTNNQGSLNIVLKEQDFNGDDIQHIADHSIDMSLAEENIKVTTTIENIKTLEFMSFVHDRLGTEDEGFINNDLFSTLPVDMPVFYVITSVTYDPSLNREVESSYSAELVGLPLTLDTQIRELPRRTRFDVSEDYISQVLRFDNEIAVIPGSVVRDVFIDPFATEAERLYFVADFIRRSQSFSTLLLVDQSDAYKTALTQALVLGSIENTQNIIDDAFDKLAANSGVTRLGSSNAVGEVMFYTTTEPTFDIVISEGTLVSTDNNINFRVTSRVTLPASNRISFYNHQRRRWEISASVVATSAGSSGNVPSARIRRIVGGLTGLQVWNPNPTRFGSDEESNEDLAARSVLAYTGVDVGTKSGYLATALRHVGVVKASVVDAGHALMMRDYDPLRKKHIGGKVDVYLQAGGAASVSDTFAFTYRTQRNTRFFLDGNPSEYTFTIDSGLLTPKTPIARVLGSIPNEITQGLGLRNLTTGDSYNVVGHEILSYNRIRLNTQVPQPSVSPDDVIVGDFLIRTGNTYMFSRQPVSQIDQIMSLDGARILEEGIHYRLMRTSDPLWEGRSTKASDHFQIIETDEFPSLESFIVNDERHILVGDSSELLSKLGVNYFSVRVFSLDRTVEYIGPSQPNPDFFIEQGNATEPVRVSRNPQGNIANGEEVSVDFEYDENFEVSYVVPNILHTVQDSVNKAKHITADVLVKQAVSNLIDLEMVIVLRPQVTQNQVDTNVRGNIAHYFQSLRTGHPVHQSDIVHAVEEVQGVDYVGVPFSRMTHGDGNLIVRESLSPSSLLLEEAPSANVFLLQNSLSYSTMPNGGDISEHKGVFEYAVSLQNSQMFNRDNEGLQYGRDLREAHTYAQLRSGEGRYIIVGSQGMSIPNYSDNTTLASQGYDTQQARSMRRRELTANKVLISLDKDSFPDNQNYFVSYHVQGDMQTKSTITLNNVTNAELGALTITYRVRG